MTIDQLRIGMILRDTLSRVQFTITGISKQKTFASGTYLDATGTRCEAIIYAADLAEMEIIPRGTRIVNNFAGYQEHQLSPERLAGTGMCRGCGVEVQVWMRGWAIAKMEVCDCPNGGTPAMLQLPQSALKEE